MGERMKTWKIVLIVLAALLVFFAVQFLAIAKFGLEGGCGIL